MNLKAIWEKEKPACSECDNGIVYSCNQPCIPHHGQCVNCKDVLNKCECEDCNGTGIQPFEPWLSEKLEEAVELLEDVNFCINEGETIKRFRELGQFLDQFKEP